jgi:cytochrome P450
VPATEAWWVFRDADVRQALESPAVFVKQAGPPAPPSSPPAMPLQMLSELPPGLLGSDPPRHDEVRAAVSPAFTSALSDAAAAAESIAAQCLQNVAHTRRFDLVQNVALPVPSSVLLHVLGLPPTHLPMLQNWAQSAATAHNITQPAGVQVYGGLCSFAMRTYYDAMVTMWQGQSAPGMLGGVCQQIGKSLQLHDVQAVMSDMLVAGYITTMYVISTGIMNLLQNPDQLAKLKATPALITGAVEEMLRHDSPAQMLDRVAASDTTLGGVAIKAGERVVLVLGSANRDEARWANPDAFDITRDNSDQIAFGDGIHTCIGAPLARITAPAAIKALLTLDDLRIDGFPQWQPDPYLRGPVSLPVAYGS